MTFLSGTYFEGAQINHKDGNPLNNHVDNLEWCTPSENVNHAFKTGLMSTNKKVILTSESGESLFFNSQRDASKFLGKSEEYIQVRLFDGCNTGLDEHGNKYKIELLS